MKWHLIAMTMATFVALSTPTEARSLTATELTLVPRLVATRLRDPASAIFTGMNAAPQIINDWVNICGWVNARNGFGGYTGNTPFVLSINLGLDKFSVTFADPSIGFIVVLKTCRDSGMPID